MTTRRLRPVVIERVTPQIEGGRYPVKRILGDVCQVGADLNRDGHGLIGARIGIRRPSQRRSQFAPMEYDYDYDRFAGTFTLDEIGRWEYWVEAWPAHWATWRRDLERRLEAGQDVADDFLEGRALLERIAARRRGRDASDLRQAAAMLGDFSQPESVRIEAALDPTLLALAEAAPSARERSRSRPSLSLIVDRREAGFGAWYELFPRSQTEDPDRHGTFADVERRLPDLADLGFDVVYLPPIHPIGEQLRKGPNNRQPSTPGDPGSPWAIGSTMGGHTAIHPQLGTAADFDRLANTAKSHGLEIALDYALQCSPDHPWLVEHPEWFYSRPDGTLRCAENPPKIYQDIYPLNFWCEDPEPLWKACRDVVLFWVDHGVRIFRVDNPHTKPFAFWEWMIKDIQAAHPDVIFLSEAFTRPKKMQLLAKLGFTQSYSYFTWKNAAWEIREYLAELTQTEISEYYRPNLFTNTPDILHEYLQTGGRGAFRVRLLLAATLSPLYGIYSGFELCENEPVRPGSEEYLDSEKYQIRVRDWQAPGNIRSDVKLLNQLRRTHPALQQFTNLQFLHSENEQILCYRKSHPEEHLIIAVNLDPKQPQETLLHISAEDLGLPAGAPIGLLDLLTGHEYTWFGSSHYIRLDPIAGPGHILYLPSVAPGSESAG